MCVYIYTYIHIHTHTQAIKDRDYAAIIEQTNEGGTLDLKLLQPMIFWSEGNAGDDDKNFVALLKVCMYMCMSMRVCAYIRTIWPCCRCVCMLLCV